MSVCKFSFDLFFINFIFHIVALFITIVEKIFLYVITILEYFYGIPAGSVFPVRYQLTTLISESSNATRKISRINN